MKQAGSTGAGKRAQAATTAGEASQRIDERIEELGDWRGATLARVRALIRQADPDVVEEWKWGVPVWSHAGIQALEAWAGTDLVDRSSYPTRLTPAGKTLYDQALEMLQSLQNTRAMLRAHTSAGKDMIEFAVPHTLAFTFFPHWVMGLRKSFGAVKSRLIALNVHDAVMRAVMTRS